jgi:hypothetical protein
MSANPVFSAEAYLEDPLSADDLDDILKEDVDIHFGDLPDDEYDDQEPEESLDLPIAKRATRPIYADASDTPPSERDQEILFKELMKEHKSVCIDLSYATLIKQKTLPILLSKRSQKPHAPFTVSVEILSYQHGFTV